MDALSKVLSAVRVEASLFSRAELTGPWGVETRGLDGAVFHVIVRGAGWATVDGGTPQAFRAGDLVVFPHGDGHVLADTVGTRPVPIRDLPATPGPGGVPCLSHGGDGPRTSILCGTFRLAEPGRGFVLRQLPSLLLVTGDGDPTAQWLESTLSLLAASVAGGGPGASILSDRLSELLFVQVLRAWSRGGDTDRVGWLAALSEPDLAPALDALHGAPEHSWTAGELARRAGMSRTSFFSRFTTVVGESPAAYLIRWRMVLARQALRGPREPLGVIAEAVGYGSEAAFSRAFKRHVGVAPSVFRRQVAV